MHLLKIVIVEDNLTIAMEIRSCLEDLGYIVCGVARNDKKAHEMVKLHQPDLIIMDVELEEGSVDGIELTKEIKKLNDLPIVYLTSHYNDALIRQRAISTKPQSFLLKPEDINPAKLSIEIELAIKHHFSDTAVDSNDTLLIKNPNDQFFFIKKNKKMLKLSFDDVIYLEANGESVFIYTDEDRLIFMLGLGKTIEKMNRPNILRIQRGFAINADKIHSYISNDKQKVVFLHHNNKLKELPFSDMYRTAITNYHPRLTTK